MDDYKSTSARVSMARTPSAMVGASSSVAATAYAGASMAVSEGGTPLMPLTESQLGRKRKTKKPKLTKAEKRERKARAKLEMRKNEIRLKFQKELELSKKSAKRGRELWEDLCKEIKIKELREEVQLWERKNHRLMLLKDDKIVRLLSDIDTTQEMHQRNFEKHVQILNYLIDSYRTLLQCARDVYESHSSELIEDFYTELHAKEDRVNKIRLNCENVMHATNLISEQQLKNDYAIYREKQDDRVNNEIEKRYRIRDDIIEKMKAMRKQLLNFVSHLQSATLDVHRNERIHWLMDRQRNFVVESQKLGDLEFRYTRTHSDLQRELLHIEVEAQRKINDLRLEHAYFMQVRKGIEDNILDDREMTFEKMQVLVSESYVVIKELQKLEKYGELLLSLAANCRKLQTESEKVVTWADFQTPQRGSKEEKDEDQKFTLYTLDLVSHVDMDEEKLVHQMRLMRNFWRRQNLVETQNLILMEEKRQLMEQNQKYINFIKSMSKADDVSELAEVMTIKCILPASVPCGNLTRKARPPVQPRPPPPTTQPPIMPPTQRRIS